MHERYIVSQIKSGFILIDQQVAHERILFERFSKGMESNNLSTQQQLFPETIHIAPSDVELLKELLPELKAFGFDIQEFGGQSFVLHGIPSGLTQGSGKEMVESMLEDFKQSNAALKINKRHQLAITMAKRTAIRRGAVLSDKEMKNLIDQLFACEAPYAGPTGQLTIITFDLDELSKLFEKGK